MSPPTQPTEPGSSKTLWAALLVLVVVLLAMGATLVRIQSRPIEPRLVVLPKPAQAPAARATQSDTTPTKAPTLAQSDAATAAGSTSAATPATSNNQMNNMPAAPSDQAQVATDPAANQAIQITAKPRPVSPRTPEPAVARPPAAGTSTAPGSAAQ